MELAQDGAIVVGRYEENNGVISGTVSGRTLDFIWTTDPELDLYNCDGIGEFTLTSDGESFEGTWQYKEGGQVFEWSGVKLGPRELTASRADVDYCLWKGSWDTTLGIVAFDQDIGESTVAGEFIANGSYGTFTGAADGWNLYGEWETEYLNGPCQFEMDDDLGGFRGTMQYDSDTDDLDWDGDFISSAIREDFTGLWDTDWGEMNIVQDRLTGVFIASIMDADVGDLHGEIAVEGNVVGNVCTFHWILEARRDYFNGSAIFTMSDTGESFSGAWSRLEDNEFISGKLSGQRQ